MFRSLMPKENCPGRYLYYVPSKKLSWLGNGTNSGTFGIYNERGGNKTAVCTGRPEVVGKGV